MTRKPHVALVAYESGGVTGVGRVVEELVRRGGDRIRFTVVSRTFPDSLSGLAAWRQAPAPKAPYRLKLATFMLTGGVRTALARADLVHVHAIGPLVPNRADLTTVHFTRAGFYETIGAGGHPLTRAHLALERRAHGRSRMLGALSEGARRDLERLFPGVPIAVTPNGVDVERFAPDSAARAEVRRELGVADDAPVALFVANAWRNKGLQVAIEALPEAPGLELWVVGYGGAERYAAYARDAGVEERVRFLGVQRRIERLYAAADLFVLPTRYEQACLSAWEAAASGLPVVITPVAGVDELAEGNGGALVVERSAAAVGDALQSLAADPELRRRLGEEGRRRAQSYTWERSVERTLEVYDELLARKGRQ